MAKRIKINSLLFISVIFLHIGILNYFEKVPTTFDFFLVLIILCTHFCDGFIIIEVFPMKISHAFEIYT